MIRVLIADDHTVVREGIRRILIDHPDISVVGEAPDGNEVLRMSAEQRPDVLLLDLAMPGPGFMGVLEQLRSANPGLKVLVLSAHAEDQYARRVLKAGAVGYITKNHSPEELVAAVRRVAGGSRYVSQAMADQLAADLSSPDRPPQELLSNREYQVLALLGAGKSVKEIAASTKLSSKTVSTYRTRLLQKLNLKTTADLIRYALEQGIRA